MIDITTSRDQIKQYIIDNIDELTARADVQADIRKVKEPVSGDINYIISANVKFTDIVISGQKDKEYA